VVSSSDAAGNTVDTTGTSTHTVDLVAQAGTVTVDNITADDIISAVEATETITVTGTATGGDISEGDTVTMLINGTEYDTTVDAAGNWTVDVAGSDLAADTEFDVVVSSSDAAGNTVDTTGTSTHTVDLTAQAGTVTVDNITADDIINAAESAQTIAVTGTATGGDIAEGDVVTMVINGTEYDTTVDAAGNWTVDVNGADLAADTEFDVVVTSSDAAGNTVESTGTSTHTVDLVAQAGTVTVDNITADDIINAVEATETITVTGTAVGGDIDEGDVVTMIINGTEYDTTVDAAGNWTVDVAGSDLAADTEFDVVVSSSDAAGNTVDTTGTSTHTVDLVAQAGTVNVDNITADDIINAAEATQTIAVTGTATGGDISEGDTVTMVINGTEYDTTVDAAGNWTVDVAGSDLAADTEFDVVVSSNDAAGNTVDTTGTSTHTVDLTAEAGTVTVDNITADDIINAVEATQTIAVTGTATGGDIAEGDVVTMLINGTEYDTTVDADGNWTVDVAGADLVADTEFDVVVTSNDAAGNTVESTGTSTHTVDLVAQAGTVSVDNITTDDIINAAEATQTIAVTGTATGGDISEGDTVTMVINGTEYDTTVDADGNWTVDVSGADLAADTEFDVVVSSSDAAGNTVESTGTSTHTVDLVAQAGTVTVDNITADDIINAVEATETITVTGTAVGGDIAEGDVVTMVINGTEYDTTVDADGNWTVDVAGSDLAADTEFDVVVSSSDAAGNTVETTGTSTHTVDLVAQAGTVTVDNITADDIINAAEATQTIAVTGTATGGDIAEGDVVTMVINGTEYDTTVDAAGNWTVDVAGSDLAADTAFDVVVSSSDAAGNTVDTTGTSTHTVDLTAQAGTVTVDNITADDVINAAESAQTIAVTGTAVGGDIAEGDVVTMIINGTEYDTTVDAAGNWTVDVSGADLAADTEFDVVVSSSDAAGNTVESTGTSTHTVDLAAQAGTVTVDNITADDIINAAESAQTIVVTGTATGGDIAEGDVVTMVINGTEYDTTVDAAGNWTVDVAGSDLAADTAFDVVVSSSDAAGNTVETTGTSTHTVDLAAPAVDITSISDDSGTVGDFVTNDNTLVFNGTTEPGATVVVSLNGVEIGSAVVDAAGNWSLDYTDTELSDADYTLSVVATDAAGNSSLPATQQITVDTAAPGIVNDGNSIVFNDADGVINGAEQTGVTFSGQVEAGGVIESIVITDTQGGSVTVNAADITVGLDGSVTVAGQNLSGLADGNLTVTMTVADVAGNIGAVADNAVLDALAPTLDIVGAVSTLAAGEESSISFTFSEVIEGFTFSDIAVNGGSLANLSAAVTNSDGTVTYTAVFTADGSGPIVVSVADGAFSDIAGNAGVGDSLSINAAPVANDVFAITDEDVVLTGNVLSNDTDADTDDLSVTGFQIGAENYAAGATAIIQDVGSLTVGEDGTYTFNPAQNWSGTVPSVTYSVVDGNGGSATAVLNITATPVADAPDLSVTPVISSLLTGATAISTGSGLTAGGPSDQGSGISASQIEQSLGLATGTLSNFAPTGGPITDNGTITAVDGKYSSQGHFLADDMSVTFNWSFVNGENVSSEIRDGFNDFAALVITGPDGSSQVQLITASELLGNGVNGSGSYTFTSSQEGNYKFDWIVMNGRDGNKESRLDIGAPSFAINGTPTGMPVALTISAGLVDPSETLEITIAGIPAGGQLSAGTYDAITGLWTLSPSELEGLMLLPPAGFTGQLQLEVTATSFDGADSASSSDMIAVSIAQTTNTISSGSSGSNSISGTAQNDLIHGYSGNDTIRGGAGDDILHGGLGNDQLIGGAGNDVAWGGLGADVFRWEFGDQGTSAAPASDVVKDFNLGTYTGSGQADRLDIADLLQGENAGSIGNYVLAQQEGADTVLYINSQGALNGAGSADQIIRMESVSMGGVNSDDFISNLISSGQLNIDQ
ncbi:MAG: hypothetical protein CVV16_05240, partial [Gammaproteobacteria bacterium HGW-Gammaproteobacteria-6]